MSLGRTQKTSDYRAPIDDLSLAVGEGFDGPGVVSCRLGSQDQDVAYQLLRGLFESPPVFPSLGVLNHPIIRHPTV